MQDVNLDEVNPSFYDDERWSKYNLSLKKAKEIGDKIGVNWDEVDLGEFTQGIKEEREHGTMYHDTHVAAAGATKVHDDSDETAARIALAHLHEMPNYYTLLEEMEEVGEEYFEKHDRREWIKQQREKYREAWEKASA
jgi:hypothetical protein